MRKLFHFILKSAGVTVLLCVTPRLYLVLKYHSRIHTVASAPSEKVAIVFGAGLWRNGQPTPVLYDRIATAVDLYQAGKVQKLLLSGDNRFVYYNEPEAMRQTALKLGVPDEDLVLDYAGRRTYDTCYRAKVIFGVKRALLVTQNFHLPRALFLCERLGLAVQGVSADRRPYYAASVLQWNVRELAATANAMVEVYFTRPEPVLGEPLPIE